MFKTFKLNQSTETELGAAIQSGIHQLDLWVPGWRTHIKENNVTPYSHAETNRIHTQTV